MTDHERCAATEVVRGTTIRCEQAAGHAGPHGAGRFGLAFGNPDGARPFAVRWGDPAPVVTSW